MQFNLKCSYIPVILMLAGCGGGGDGGTSSAPGGGSCDNASVQGTYAGAYDITIGGNATTAGLTWQATIEGDSISFKSTTSRNDPTITGTLQNCRFDTASNHNVWFQAVCKPSEQFQMTLIFNGNQASGDIAGTCNNLSVSGPISGNRT